MIPYSPTIIRALKMLEVEAAKVWVSILISISNRVTSTSLHMGTVLDRDRLINSPF